MLSRAIPVRDQSVIDVVLIWSALILQEGDVDAAQENKSKLEQLQRADQALRIAGRKAWECC